MKSKKIVLSYILPVFAICIIHFVALAQTNKIDSLLNSIKIMEDDTNKVNKLCLLSKEYSLIGEYDKGLNFGKEALTLSESIRFKKGIANSSNRIGSIYTYQGKYPDALKSIFNALKIREEIKDEKGVASSYISIAAVYIYQGNNNEALKCYSNAFDISKKIGYKEGISSSYVGFGIIYGALGKYEEALKNYFDALKIEKLLGDKDGIAITYMNIAEIYSEMGNYQEALNNSFASLKTRQAAGNKGGIAVSYINIGNLYLKANKIKEAEDYLNNGLQLCKEIGNKEWAKNSYKSLITIDSIKGNYKAAFEHQKLFIISRDSLINEEANRKSLQTSMQYEYEKQSIAAKAKQEKLDALAIEESEKQKIVIYSVIGVLLIVIIFSLFLFNRFRITKKQKNIIEIKERETQVQKHLIEEKHKEITDSINYAERIQRSFLATKELLDENLKDYFVFFKPKDVVSGDFYWASKLKNNYFVLVTADSTGHGVPGAIMSLLNITSLEKAIEENVQPSDILNSTRNIIIDRLKKDGSVEGGKDGMDCSLMCFDFKNRKLIIGAANNPIWIVRGTEIIEIKPDKMPVGKHDRQNNSFTQQEIELKMGDVIYSLTDGFPDQFGGERGKKFMSKNLRELLAVNSKLPMPEQKELLEKAFLNWVGDIEQVDDVTVIGVRI